MADWKDILADNDEVTSDNDSLSKMDQPKGETKKDTTDNIDEKSFDSDAMEGLAKVQDPEKVKQLVRQLKQSLKKQIKKKQERKNKRKIKIIEWTIYAVLLLLLLCIAGFFLIRIYI